MAKQNESKMEAKVGPYTVAQATALVDGYVDAVVSQVYGLETNITDAIVTGLYNTLSAAVVSGGSSIAVLKAYTNGRLSQASGQYISTTADTDLATLRNTLITAIHV